MRPFAFIQTECIAQLACYPKGREKLLQDPSVRSHLETVCQSGICVEAKQMARSALLALSGTELRAASGNICKGGGEDVAEQPVQQRHVMLSCESVCHCHGPCFLLRSFARSEQQVATSSLHASDSIARNQPDQWSFQSLIKRLDESLIKRDYRTWFDRT